MASTYSVTLWTGRHQEYSASVMVPSDGPGTDFGNWYKDLGE